MMSTLMLVLCIYLALCYAFGLRLLVALAVGSIRRGSAADRQADALKKLDVHFVLWEAAFAPAHHEAGSNN